MSVPFTVIIPARLASTRLPNKPIADIEGVPMIVRVARQAALSGARRVICAVDSPVIAEACQAFGVEAVLTSQNHSCGTDRLCEAAVLAGLPEDEIVVNVQGDEPLIPPKIISSVAELLVKHPDCSMGTAALPISDVKEFANPNVVKVVCDKQGKALLFSRAPIPWARDNFNKEVWEFPSGFTGLRHVGIYSYTCSFLKKYANLPSCRLETTESLEQLRALWNGYSIAVEVFAEDIPAGVDTIEDLERVRAFLRKERKE
jgi:3-deoxy-manno-octulosonate cytidylyltransferase (CMP-KDO synthetase)